MANTNQVSVPIKLLFEGIHNTVTVEMKNGESYRGDLTAAEENMNMQMSGVIHTSKNGQKKKLEHVYLRGTNVKLVIFPSMLREATIFRKVEEAKKNDERKKAARSAGRGRGKR